MSGVIGLYWIIRHKKWQEIFVKGKVVVVIKEIYCNMMVVSSWSKWQVA